MASFVNATDAVAAAVEIERRGHVFYQKAQEHAAKPDDKELIAALKQALAASE